MKTKMLTLCCVLLFAMVLAGCGAKGENGAAEPAANSKSAEVEQTKESEGSKTRLYKHAMGEANIPVKAEKVVTLQYLSQMMSVGVKPIGATTYLFDGMGDLVKGIEDVGNEKINYEKILELNPELIIAGDVDKEAYSKLSQIAPTVVIPWMDHDVYGHVQTIGDILGRQKEAEDWKTAFNAKVEDAKKQIFAKIGEGRTAAIYNIRPKEFYVYGVRNFGFTIYKALGLTPPAPIQKEIEKDPNFWAVPISLEVMPDYAADYIFVTSFADDDSKKHLADIKNSALWKNLPAVKNNHVYELDMDKWFGYTPHDIEFQLQDVLNKITK